MNSVTGLVNEHVARHFRLSIRKESLRGVYAMTMLGVALNLAPAWAQTLLVASSSTQHISATYRPLYLDALEMQDDATIVVDDDIDEWRVQIRSARFGARTRIVANGADGANGPPSGMEVRQATYCESGGQVSPSGGNGQPGGNGKKLTMVIGIALLNDLTIVGNGGRGGDGGRGARGRKGGQASCFCDGGTGGTGGRGGAGGDGGSTSRVRIDWYPVADFAIDAGALDAVARAFREVQRAELVNNYGGEGSLKLPSQSVPQSIESQLANWRFSAMTMFPVGLQVSLTPGEGGIGGTGGPAGYAGEGRRCEFWSKGSGAGGVGGPFGPQGLAGTAFPPIIQRIAP